MNNQDILDALEGTEIAVIGMAGRFPGAKNIDSFWQNLRDGVESVTFYSDEELRAARVDEATLRNPNYVKSGAPLEDMEMFDAAFFGFGPRDAAIMDPQHRHFLECAWEALEHAGHDPGRFEGLIGIYGGSGHNAYMPYNLLTNPSLMASVGSFLIRHTGNDKDFLTTRVSYLLNLKGPSVNVQTACSTSLVAIHMACQSLLNSECDMALAGGVTIELPHRQGYIYHEGEILSSDGHCRPFDADSKGTIFGSGVGMVVLRRLADAIEAGDTIHAVIKGSAINNDGSGKVNYLAPSVDGQAAAIAEAIAIANVEAHTISYVETHGTGTRIGDPIEVTALTQAFRSSTDKRGFCGIGSIKSNIGHLDTAAGVASFIKTVLALKHKRIPPNLNFKQPNPIIDFENSPFYVNAQLTEWKTAGFPRRAGINSLGVGGTNAYLILEEAPAFEASGSSRPWQLLLLSAKSGTALDVATTNLAQYLRNNPDINLADVAYTLQVGRQPFGHRRMFICQEVEDAISVLENFDPVTGTPAQDGKASRKRVFSQNLGEAKPSVVFMFPGGGAQYPNMGRELYEQEPVYREHIDQCFALLQSYLDADLKSLMFPPNDQVEAAAAELQRPSLALPALFMTEYALAKLWLSWGIQPAALIGHSMGEYTAVCLADVLSLEDALAIVTLRGQLFETLPEGAMLSVPLPEEEVRPLLIEDLSIAVINNPSLCVVSGRVQAIGEMEKVLASQGVECRRIKISVAAHSAMLDPILGEFGQRLANIQFNAPTIPTISNVTGTWVKPEDVTDPNYWVQHLRQTVRFADGLSVLLKDDPNRIFLEVGPGQTLSSFVGTHPDKGRSPSPQASLPHPKENVSDLQFFLTTLGKLWLVGVKVDWPGFYVNERRSRISLPTYPFERQRYWIEPGAQLFTTVETAPAALTKKPNLADWFYRPVWKKSASPQVVNWESGTQNPLSWLVFKDTFGLGHKIAQQLEKVGHTVVTVTVGEQFAQLGEKAYAVNPRVLADYDALVEELVNRQMLPQRIAHLWTVNTHEKNETRMQSYYKNQDLGFYSLLFLAQALADEELPAPLHISVIANGMQRVNDEVVPYPEKATLLGPCQVIPKEFPHITCQAIDIILPESKKFRFLESWTKRPGDQASQQEQLVSQLMAELAAEPSNSVVAYRRDERWVQSFEPAKVDKAVPEESRLRDGGVYLITGGLGGIGLVMAEYLAKTVRAKLVLISRSGLPAREEWENWLRIHSQYDETSHRIQKVQALEALSAEVLTIAADVTDREQMTEAIAQARHHFGPIHGIIHAAGVLNDGLIQLKTPQEADHVFAPKVRGTLLLDELLQAEQAKLDFFMLFSSTSTILGPAGQVDYVGANAFLNAFAQSKTAETDTYTVAINWGVWQGVGMAAQAAMRLGLTESEQSMGKEMAHPLLDKCIIDTPEETIYSTEYSLDKHWILEQHRIKGGEALIPGTGYLEIAKAALEKDSPNGPVEIRELFFVAPLEVKANETKEVRVTLEKNGDGYAFVVTSRSTSNELGKPWWQEHTRGKVAHVKSNTSPNYSIQEIAARCNLRETTFGAQEQETKQETYLDFGPRWKNLRRMNFGAKEALALLELPQEFTADLENYTLHPALMDLATSYALPLIEGYETGNAFYVPLSYKRVRINRPLPKKIYSYVRYKSGDSAQKEVPVFDVTIMDEHGNALVEIDEFTLKRVSPESMIANPQGNKARDAQKVVNKQPVTTGGAEQPLHPDAEPTLLQLALTEGILPDEGMDAFSRILSGNVPSQIVVTSLDLDLLVKQVNSDVSEAEESTGLKLSRPNLPSSYQAPRNEIEKTLVKFWAELLGIDEVGIHDNFFELGGHSLIAVRLFAKIKKTFAVDLSLATLFEVPTIAQFAELLQDELGQTISQTQPKRKRRKDWSPLVAIQPKGSKPPFFCVHGIHGNVLIFSYLARYLGSEQPFYGLQAQGADGKRPGHRRLEDMAALYIEEIRSIQPEGPYHLGGFSMGGEIAFEMAQQLATQGQEVTLLALLDTVDPGHARLRGRQLVHDTGGHDEVKANGHLPDTKSTNRIRKFLSRSPKEKVHSLIRWTDGRAKFIQYKIAQLYLRMGRTLSQGLTEHYMAGIHSEALLAYTPRPYPGRITLFRAVVTLQDEAADPAMRWSALAQGGLEVHLLDGPHEIVEEPYVQVLAQKLKACLA